MTKITSRLLSLPDIGFLMEERGLPMFLIIGIKLQLEDQDQPVKVTTALCQAEDSESALEMLDPEDLEGLDFIQAFDILSLISEAYALDKALQIISEHRSGLHRRLS